MLIKTDTTEPSELNTLLTREQRVYHVGQALILAWRDVHNSMLLWEVAMLKESVFIDMMIKTTPEGLTLAQGFTRRDWGAVHQQIKTFVRAAEAAGAAWRKRKGDKMSLGDFKNIIRQQADRAKKLFN